MPSKENKIRVGITVGDINGIGTEIIIKTFSNKLIYKSCSPVIYGSSKLFSFYCKLLKSELPGINNVKDIDNIDPDKPNLFNCWEEDINITPGVISETTGTYAFKSLEKAAEDLQKGKIDTLVTAPINKKCLNKDGYQYSGHTEYLAKKFNCTKPLMLMICENLKIGLVTEHLPVNQISKNITPDNIKTKLFTLINSLREDFGIDMPKVAVLALNPHAGENGLIGNEDKDILSPLIKQSNEQYLSVYGPYSADGFFGSNTYSKFDGVLAMYHDQGLIPFKLLSFGKGVNFTAGLPYVRTSPDHGTAYNIAGKNIASPQSMINAILMACKIFSGRKEFQNN